VTINGGTFNVIVDTGSSTLAVASQTCSTSGGCGTYVTPTVSLSGLSPGKAVSTQYGSGNWSGVAYTTGVSVGSSAAASVTWAAINKEYHFFQQATCTDFYGEDGPHAPNQGILGFAMPDLAEPPTTLWFSSWVSTTTLPSIFTLQMCGASGTL
jgi:hypothetical protein